MTIEKNVRCYVDEQQVNCDTWETETADTKLQQRRQLCDDLYWLIKQDKDMAEEIIDEYVYMIDDTRAQELMKLCKDEGVTDY